MWDTSMNGNYRSGWVQPVDNKCRQDYLNGRDTDTCSTSANDWENMLEILYDPKGRRDGTSTGDYLFEYVRVAPLLLSLNPAIKSDEEHQKELNKYTSWMRTYFDSDCCDEFHNVLQTQTERKRTAFINNKCGSQSLRSWTPQQCKRDILDNPESAAFRVIAGMKECWNKRELVTGQCMDAMKIPQIQQTITDADKAIGNITSADSEEKKRETRAMWALISNGLVTCQKTLKQMEKRARASSHFNMHL